MIAVVVSVAIIATVAAAFALWAELDQRAYRRRQDELAERLLAQEGNKP